MLGLNPGLKEITHSITGGALAAQGTYSSFLILAFIKNQHRMHGIISFYQTFENPSLIITMQQ